MIFKRIPVEAIVQRLKDLAAEENITIDEDSLYLIARKADGGMRDALSLMDQTISYCGDKIEIARVRQIFGMIPTQVYFEFMQKIKEARLRASSRGCMQSSKKGWIAGISFRDAGISALGFAL